MKLKTLKVEERFINYKVFRCLWLVNMLRIRKEFALSVEKNINPQMEEVKLVQKNVRKKGSFNMIRNIFKNIQRFQEKHLKIGNRTTEKKLIKERENDGGGIRNCRLEISPIISSKNLEYQDMENVNYVKNYPTDKFIIQNTIRRTSF